MGMFVRIYNQCLCLLHQTSHARRHFKRTGKMKWREFATPLPYSSPLEKVRVPFCMIAMSRP
jgi:hypothetical protein